jgi:hypothetical protein
MAGLEVQIGADNAELEKKIADAEGLIAKFAKQKEAKVKIGADTSDLEKKIAAANANLDKLKKGLDSTAPSFNKFTKNTADGGNTLTQFSRIAQDAPFGIIGIGNNLTATAEAFGALSKQAGGAGGALKAVATSLMGTGGILLAVSLVTTGLTYMAQKGITLSDVFNKLSGTFDQARKDLQDLNVETAKNAQAQISSLGAYVSVAKNINLSMQDRLIAVKKLQDEYPAYFANLTKEQILNGNIANTVREVTAALIAKAKAAGLTDRIVKLAEEEEKIQNSINNSIASQFKQYRLTKQEAYYASVILNKQLRGQIDLVGELNAGRANDLSKAEKTALAAYQYSHTLQDLGVEIRKNISDQDKLTGSLEKQTAAQIKLDYTKEKTAKKTYDTPQVSGLGSTVSPVNDLVSLSGMLAHVAKNVEGYEGVISTSFKGIRLNVSKELLETMKLIYDFNNELDKLVKGSLTKTFEDLGTSIGTALAQGKNVFGAIGKSLIASLGAFLSDMGSLLIKYGTLAVAKGVIDKALTSGNPVVTIGAGVAAIAVGVALKAAGGAIASKASASSGGSSSTSSYSTGASYSSPGSTSSSSGGSSFTGGGTVVFEISGSSLIGVLKNTLDNNKRLGGSLTI